MATQPLQLRPNEPLQVTTPDGKIRWTEYCHALFRQFQSGLVAPVNLETEVDGDLPVGNGGTGGSTAITGFDNLSPLTDEGDLLTHDGTNNVRLPIGAANSILTSDGTEASWQPAGSVAGGSWIPLVDGSEPPVFITDGAGVLILVAYP